MKKNNPGCTCCKPHIFTLPDAKLSQLSDERYYAFTGLPGWVANINATFDANSEAAVWVDFSYPPYTMPGGVVLTPEGWLYFAITREGVEGSEDQFRYVILPIDLASGEYVATQTNQPPAAILQNNNRVTYVNVKVVAKTPGRDAGGVDDVAVHITSLASVGGLDTSDWLTTDIHEFIPHQSIYAPGGSNTSWYVNPEYVNWGRTAAEKLEPAHGVDVYSPSGELVQKYSVAGAIHTGVRAGRYYIDTHPHQRGRTIAPTGESVYWLADARAVRWWRTEQFQEFQSWWLGWGINNAFLLEGEEYGNLVEPSAFPFADLVQDEDVLEAAGAPRLEDRFWIGDTQYFQFLIHNSEPLALLPIITGSIEYISRQYHYGGVLTYDEDGRPIIPFTETRDTKRAKFILENACLTYSHAIDAPVLVGNYGNSVVQAGGVTVPQNFNLDEITLDDPGLAGKTVVYKYDGEWVEITRFDRGSPSAICEGVDGAIYVLGPYGAYGNGGASVFRVDAKTGSAEQMADGYFSPFPSWGRNWMALPTNPFHDFLEREAQNPPPTVGG